MDDTATMLMEWVFEQLDEVQRAEQAELERVAEHVAGELLDRCAAFPMLPSLEMVSELYEHSGQRWERARQVGEQLAYQIRERMERRYGPARK